MEKVEWDDYFMTMVYLVAMRSKDESTHIGAVIVGPDNEIRSTGYNSFPRGMNDDLEERQERPQKYFVFEHAERNAIYNVGLWGGGSLKGCRIYTNGVPCTDCARAVIQVGIKEVIVDGWWDKNNAEKWAESAKISIEMFDEVGIKVRYYSGNFMNIVKYKRGDQFDLCHKKTI